MYKTLVSFDGSLFSFFLLFSFFSPPRCVGMFCRPVVQTGNLFVGILQRIIFFCFSSLRHLAFVFFLSSFLPYFLLLFLACGIAKEETDLPVESCHLQPVA